MASLEITGHNVEQALVRTIRLVKLIHAWTAPDRGSLAARLLCSHTGATGRIAPKTGLVADAHWPRPSGRYTRPFVSVGTKVRFARASGSYPVTKATCRHTDHARCPVLERESSKRVESLECVLGSCRGNCRCVCAQLSQGRLDVHPQAYPPSSNVIRPSALEHLPTA